MNPASQDRARDWYSVLGISAQATAQEITAAVERLTRQATALSVTDPDRSRQLREQARDIKRDLLSGDLERQRYDQSLASGLQVRHPPATASPASQSPATASPASQFPAREAPTMPAAEPGPGVYAAGSQAGPPVAGPPRARGQGLTSRVARFLQTGWTCPACGHGAMPADKFCQKCGSRIQIVAKVEQPPEAVNSGRQSVVCGNCRTAIPPGNAFCTRCGTPRS